MSRARNLLREAFDAIREAPRVSAQTLEAIAEEPVKRVQKPVYKRGNRLKYHNFPPLGHVDGRTPMNIRTPKYPYYKYQENRPEFYPLSLFRLQNMIDMGVIDPRKPIDFGKLAISKLAEPEIISKMQGVQLTEEGSDVLTTAVMVEVQYVQSERVIAAVERVGGRVITAYLDHTAIKCLHNPAHFFKQGLPLPPRSIPPKEHISYYTDPNVRGYLCEEEAVVAAKEQLSLKMGYTHTREEDYVSELYQQRKQPRQIFFNLNPGCIVNLIDKSVIRVKLNSEYDAVFNKQVPS